MISEIKRTRKNLQEIIDRNNGDLLNYEVINQSQKLDKLIVIEQERRLLAMGGE